MDRRRDVNLHRGENGGGSWPPEPWPAGTPGRDPVGRSNRWWPLLVVALLAVVVVGVVLHPRTPLVAPNPAPAPAPAASTASPSPRATPASRSAEPPLLTHPPPTPSGTVDLGHRVLGVTAGWELFARGDDSLMRIEMASGRVTRTTGVGIASGGPVSFLAGPDRVIIRPLDFVAGFVVRDGGPPAELTGALSHGGPAVTGPDAAHLWVDTATDGGPSVMSLADWNGTPTPTSFPVPKTWSGASAWSDGAGGLLFTAQDGGTYQVSRSRRTLLTTGSLLAVGPTGYLVSECVTAGKCLTSFIERNSSKRRTLAASIVAFGGAIGVISPDGRTAAVIDVAKVGSSPARLSLVDVASGVAHPLGAELGIPSRSSGMVWSPDGRWLFVVTAAGHVAVVDPDTRQVGDLGFPLPLVEQLAIRAAPKPGPAPSSTSRPTAPTGSTPGKRR